MTIMNEAVLRNDWERMQKGQPPLPKQKVVRPEPEPPRVENQIKFEDVPLTSTLRLLSKVRDNLKNSEGIAFTGYRICIEEIESKKTLTGWVSDGDFGKLLPFLRESSDVRVLSAF